MAEPTAPRLTSDSDFAGYLSPNQAAAYFDEARKSSVFQTLAREVPLGINGEQVPVVTSKASASWVAEGGRKPLSKGTVGLKSMKPQKIAAIAVVSAEVVRANPANYVELFRADIAEAMGLAFDAAVLHGTNSPFGAGMNLDAASIASVEIGTGATVYDDLVSGLSTLVNAKTSHGTRRRLTGFAFDSVIEPVFLSAKDGNGTPLLVLDGATDTAEAIRLGRVIGRRATMSDGIATDDLKSVVGYGGDFSQVVWGKVGGITYDVSTEATVTIDGTLTSLWEHNLVAIRAEAEFGVLLNTDDNGKASFVKYTNAA